MRFFRHLLRSGAYTLLLLAQISCLGTINLVDDKTKLNTDNQTILQKKEEFKHKDKQGSMILVEGAAFLNGVYTGSWYGSGVVVGHNEKLGTLTLTAGHVCDPGPAAEKKKKEDTAIWKMRVITKTGEWQEATQVFVAKKFDACLINTKLMDAPVIPLSAERPVIGDKIYNISAPFGAYSADLSMMFEGIYSGKMQIPSGEMLDVYSMPATHGMSGSPMLNEAGEIVGVLSRVNAGFHHITLSVLFEDLQVLFNGKADVENIIF